MPNPKIKALREQRNKDIIAGAATMLDAIISYENEFPYCKDGRLIRPLIGDILEAAGVIPDTIDEQCVGMYGGYTEAELILLNRAIKRGRAELRKLGIRVRCPECNKNN